MFLTRFRNITLHIGTLLLCLSAPLHAVVIYETDFMVSPPNASTTTIKGDFTTNMPAWTPVPSFSSAYLTTGSSGACTITFTKALDLSKYKDVQILIDYGSESSRPLLVNVNGDGDVSVHTMVSAEKKTVIHTSLSTSAASISTIHVHSSGGGAVYFFHLAIIGTPLTDCPEEPAKGDTTAYFFKGQSVTVWGRTFSSETTVDSTYKTPEGCDSIVTLYVKETTSGSVTRDTICEKNTPYHWEADGKDYNQTTSASVVKKNKLGTDSICMLYLIVNPTLRTSESHYMNEGESYTWHGQTYTKAGDYTFDTISKVTGCDSIVTLHLFTSTPTETKVTICQGDTFYWYVKGVLKGTYTKSAEKSTTVDGVKYYLYLTVQSPSYAKSTYKINLSIHEEYTWRNKTYSLPGIYLDTVSRYETGCPKNIEYLVLDGDTAAAICDGVKFYWDRTGKEYGSASTISLKVASIKINGSTVDAYIYNKITKGNKSTSTTKVTISKGESYTWFGKEYTQQGTYEDDTTNAAGCDSLGTLILGVCGNVPDTGYVKAVINQGEAFYWRYTNTSYRESTRDTANFKTIYGCDSVAILDLTVQNVPAGHLAKTICEGDVYDWHGMKLTEAGVYTYGSEVLHLGVLPNPNIEACEDKIIQHGEETSVKLFVTGADYYKWKPKETLSSEWDTEPIASPIVTTDYIARSYNSAGANTVINGDFEMGPDAAASGKASDPNLPSGAIASYYTHLWYTRNDRTFGTHIITQKSGELFGKSNATPDHTKGDGTGWMMVIDGFNRAQTPNDSIMWQQTDIDVIPNTDYIFSAYFMTVLKGSTAKLQFCVNGVPLGAVREAPTATDTWMRYYELWACDSTTTKATLTITNLNPDGTGNDFALDDISFQALGPCYGLDTVKVIINFDIHLFPSCTHIIDQREPNEVPGMTDRTVTFHIPEYCTDQFGTYLKGDQLTVYAHDEECRVFSKWSDDNTDNPRIFTVGESDFTIYPIYVGEPFTITTDQEGEGTVTETTEYMCRDTAIVTATPDPCWQFIKWKEDGDTNPIRKFEVIENRTFTAIFQKLPYVITVKTKDGTTTKGSVTGQVNNE